ncbi:MAG: beta-ketoacyl-ACP synthase II [Candidatus Kapaibacteriota bacterium]|jgi:3-oxoacyl-[acyl-carrier-protein] synthase II
MQRKTIVISGIGAITPIGEGVDAYWEGLLAGKSGAVPISGFDTADYDCKFACEVRNFDATKYLDRKSLSRLDKYCQFGIIAAEMAMKDAKFHLPDMDTTRIGVVFGSGIGGMISYDAQFRGYMAAGPRRVSPFFVPQMIPDMAAGMISIRNNLRGPNYATVSACATSLHAMIDAYMILNHGMADMMICGGAEASITPMAIAGFGNMQALSTRNDSPETASRPYDKDRDGFVMGEGAGAFVVETLESAQARGAHIYAEIAGVGMTADAHHMTAPHPEGEGALRAMQMAMNGAGITAQQLDYINTHGTSTPLGDVAEITSIKKLYAENTDALSKVNISSTKSMTGHLLGAAGAIESIACVKAIQHQIVPPTINVFNQDERIDVNVTPNKPQERSISYVLNNGFGFGGHNATLIFKKI